MSVGNMAAMYTSSWSIIARPSNRGAACAFLLVMMVGLSQGGCGGGRSAPADAATGPDVARDTNGTGGRAGAAGMGGAAQGQGGAVGNGGGQGGGLETGGSGTGGAGRAGSGGSATGGAATGGSATGGSGTGGVGTGGSATGGSATGGSGTGGVGAGGSATGGSSTGGSGTGGLGTGGSSTGGSSTGGVGTGGAATGGSATGGSATGGAPVGTGGAAGAAPAVFVDQLNVATGGFIGLQPDQHISQSFTVGRAGHLVGIAVPMFRDNPVVAGDRVTLTLYACSALDTCGASAIASATIPTDSLPLLTFPPSTPQYMGVGYFDLSAAPVAIVVNQLFRFRLDSPGDRDFGVLDSSNGEYPRGLLFSQNSASAPPILFPLPLLDMAFGTYVTN